MSSQVSKRFLRLFPSAFLVDLVRQITTAYPAADGATDSLDAHIRRNVAGVQRWGIIESHLNRLAEEYGVEAEWLPNSTGSAYHVELRSEEYLLTVAKTDERGRLPREAEYRTTLLAESQLRLFAEPNPTGTHILGIVVHGPDEDGCGPNFIDVLFPDPDGQIVDRFDLLSFARVQSANELEEEVVEDAAQPEIRRHGETGTQDS
jgi:hypothetical protein